MFEHFEILRRDRHGGLRFKPVPGFGFARAMNRVPVTFGELPEIVRQFPLVFLDSERGRALPQALLGLQPGSNAFVDEQGRWQGDYIPMHLRRYPFLLGRQPRHSGSKVGEDHYLLMIDPAAPHFQDTEGERLFGTDGKPGEVMIRAKRMLSELERDARRTMDLVTLLDEAGVLLDHEVAFEQAGKRRAFRGFRTVERGRLAHLAPATLADWVGNGALTLVELQRMSLVNFRRLAARQNLSMDDIPSAE